MAFKSTKWDQRYLNIAREVASWSKDPSSKIGAVAVGYWGQILSQGYNGFPRGIEDSEARLTDRAEKIKRVIHAEMNCIYNAARNGVDLKGADVYVYGLPTCRECAKALIQVGATRIIGAHSTEVKVEWAESHADAEEMFREAGIPTYSYPASYSVLSGYTNLEEYRLEGEKRGWE